MTFFALEKSVQTQTLVVLVRHTLKMSFTEHRHLKTKTSTTTPSNQKLITLPKGHQTPLKKTFNFTSLTTNITHQKHQCQL